MSVVLKTGYDQPEAIRQLFTEYTEDILQKGPEVAGCLASQHYDDEIRNLRGKYGPPEGRLYLALSEEQAAGCVALRKIDGSVCEMKRLYVRPAFRGQRIGKLLVERVIADAAQIGYRHIRLDTFPFMSDAVALYRRYGFYEIERYNDNPAPSAVFMQLDLQR
ncbi:MAG: GNAT family N-acetyltransferase [Eubacteriales bacterium]|nr:GNAT family N-acetyltransferase [Eubacteriales bacterium]